MDKSKLALYSNIYPGCYLGRPYINYNLNISSADPRAVQAGPPVVVNKGTTTYTSGINSSFKINLGVPLFLNDITKWEVCLSYFNIQIPIQFSSGPVTPTSPLSVSFLSNIVQPTIVSSSQQNLLRYTPITSFIGFTSNAVFTEKNYVADFKALANTTVSTIIINIIDQDGDPIPPGIPSTLTICFRKYL